MSDGWKIHIAWAAGVLAFLWLMSYAHAGAVKTIDENVKWFTDPKQAAHAEAISEAEHLAAKSAFNTCALILQNQITCKRVMKGRNVFYMKHWTEQQWHEAAQ